jgi:hypothetical protein
MSFCTSLRYTKYSYDLLQNGFGVVQDDDIPVDLAPTVDFIHQMIIRVEEDDSGLDAITSCIDMIDNILQINKLNDDVGCPLFIKKSGEDMDDPAIGFDPHAVVANVSLNPLPRRKHFASTWKRIKRSVLRLCCCVR